MRDCLRKEKNSSSKRVLHWYERRRIQSTNNTYRYFFNPSLLNEHFERYVHVRLSELEQENGIEYTESLKNKLNQYEMKLSPLVKYLCDGIEKPTTKDILDACKLDPDFTQISLVDLCLVLLQVGEAKAFLDEHETESDLLNTLFRDNEGLSLRDAVYEYMIRVNMYETYQRKDTIVISKAICDLMGSANSKVNGILTLHRTGLHIDAYILSAILCSDSTHSAIKDLMGNNLHVYFPSMKYFSITENLEYEQICSTFDYSSMINVDPILLYRFIRNAVFRLEKENDLKKKISGRMMLSTLVQRTLLLSLLTKDTETVLLMLKDFFIHVPDNVLSDMFANVERVFFCQVFEIVADVVDVLDFHTKNALRTPKMELTRNCSVSVLVSTWFQNGWIVNDANNNNNDDNIVATCTSILSKFSSLVEDSKLKFCIKLAQSLLRYDAMSLKKELSTAFKMDESEANHVLTSLKKNYSADCQNQNLNTILCKIETLLFG